MSKLIRNIVMLGIVTILLATNVGQAFAASASILSTRFSLYRWDGPMYLDVNANCSYREFVDIDGYVDYWDSGSAVNGSRRVWLYPLSPRTTRTVTISCHSSPDHGVYWQYSIWFSGATMRISRTAVGSF